MAFYHKALGATLARNYHVVKTFELRLSPADDLYTYLRQPETILVTVHKKNPSGV